MSMATTPVSFELLSRESVKPSSPTPTNLRIYRLSFLDHLRSFMYVPIIFFYSMKKILDTDTVDLIKFYEETSQKLKQSLSVVLTHYYPFAGRFKDLFSIDCNDEGVTFLVARIKQKYLWEILENPKDEFLQLMFADQRHWKGMESNASSILAIQVNFFDCGGIAISVCTSHRIADACTMINFIGDWSKLCGSFGDHQKVSPVLDAASVFPHGELPTFQTPVTPEGESVQCKRYMFEASKVNALKFMVSEKVKDPSRVQVVAALLWKSIVSVSTASDSTPPQEATETILMQPVNLRTRMVPPLPQSTVGNILAMCETSCRMGQSTTANELQNVVTEMKQAFVKFCKTHEKLFTEKDMSSLIPKPKNQCMNLEGDKFPLVCIMSSWCRFPIYEIDFGWGKPTWVTTACSGIKNFVVLMDMRDGEGIEAVVSLEAKEMAAFECNKELLAYASTFNLEHSCLVKAQAQ